MHAMMAALDLVRQGLRAHGQRIGVRHFEHGRDATHHRRQRTAFEVFLVGETGLAKMHLGVDHARQQMQTLAVDHLAGRSARKVVNGREAPRADAQIERPLAVVVDHDATLEDQVVRIGHAGTHLNGA